ncbi:MAG TPA: hypothetical protein VFP12_05715 [Allosphingosinicella sp.]|nr:hypothetical protein [Allosphingosinicella sp.]
MSACDQEPCKSLIDRYWANAIAGSDSALAVRLHCDVRRRVWRGYRILLSLWAAALASALACHAVRLEPWLCLALDWMAIVLLAGLFVWGARLALLERNLGLLQETCRRHWHEMLSLRRSIAVQCPRECQPEPVEFECDC